MKTKMQPLLIWLSPIFLISTIAINALANILPLNGKTTGEISNAIPILFAPANYVFSIWSLIYFGLLVFVIYQIIAKQKVLAHIRPAFLLSCVANGIWIVFWHYQYFWLSVLTMIVLFFSLMNIYLKIQHQKKESNTKGFFWCIEAPFSIYFGWITIALIANIATALEFHEWNGWGLSDTLWTINMLVIACAIGSVNILQNKDYLYGSVLIWATIGIAINQIDIPLISWTAGSIAVLLFFVSLIAGIRRYKLQ